MSELPGANAAAVESLSVVPKIEPVAAQSDALTSVDNAFGSVVDLLSRVLFFRIGQSRQTFIVYDRAEPYVRTADTQDVFRPLNQADRSLEPQLTVADLARLQGEGLLVEGSDSEPAVGLIGGRSVEYVRVAIPHEDPPIPHGTKFVRQESGDWWPIGRKRAFASAEGKLTGEQVAKMSRDGYRVRVPAPGFVDETNAATWSDGKLIVFDDGDWIKPWALHWQTESVGGVPFVVGWLLLGSLFFTIRMGFVNFWAFGHAVQVVRGKYDDPEEAGEVTHAQALASALSATVGLGNIAGVTIAMTAGGPGAFFWMGVCGFLGMSSKFVECTLAQKYRDVGTDGAVLGGPMRYLKVGLAEKGFPTAGKVLAMMFALLCVLAAMGGGNMFQANQAAGTIAQIANYEDNKQLSKVNAGMAEAASNEDGVRYTELRDERVEINKRLERTETLVRLAFGLLLSAVVAAVILGGIKRIGATASKIVPAMCGMYLLMCLAVIAGHVTEVPALIASIFTEAFTGKAVGGGFLGALIVAVTGVQRAAFSNEAGVGSAAIAHSAAKTQEPVREGCVALLGPFIDTLVVCSVTALMILITGAWDNTGWGAEGGLSGAALTSEALGSEVSWFPYLLTVAVVLFAFSTIISWSYYGEKATESLLGRRAGRAYRFVTVACAFLGANFDAGKVLDLADLSILTMAFPNVLGCVILSGAVKADLRDYWRRLKAGEFEAGDQ